MSHSDSQPEKTPETFWQNGFKNLRSIASGAVYISLCAFILPQILYELVFAHQTSELVEISKEFAKNRNMLDFYNLLEPAASYASALLFSGAFVWFVHLCGYLGLVHLAHCAATGKKTPALHETMLTGFRLALKRGVLVALLFVVMFFLVQLLLPPAILALLPGLMIPVLIVTGTSGVIQPIAESLKMSYGKSFPGGKWALFFQLMSLGAFFYAGVLLTVFLGNQILGIDTWLNLPRALWNTSIAGLPVSPMYILSILFKLSMLSFIACFLASISVTFYVWVRRLPAGGVVV